MKSETLLRRIVVPLKQVYLFLLYIVLTVGSPFALAADNTCAFDIDAAATSLGEAWQKAKWRNGLHPFRYYNSRALKRIFTDPDLAKVAARWQALSEKSNDAVLMDQTYQYLVGLADLRIKY